MFHKSVTPCEQYGTQHSCYACQATHNSQGHINDIANALEGLGVGCFIDQTGGMTMVGTVVFGKDPKTVQFTDELVIVHNEDYFGEDYSGEYGEIVLENFTQCNDEEYTELAVKAIAKLVKG